MKAGRELDKLIAENVMDGKRYTENSILAVDVSAKSFTIGESHEYPRYSTEISEAWDVVEKLCRDRHFEMHICMRPLASGEHEDRFIGYMARFSPTSGAQADTSPHAICLAALRANGIAI